jgi:signal transduction histidine kinase
VAAADLTTVPELPATGDAVGRSGGEHRPSPVAVGVALATLVATAVGSSLSARGGYSFDDALRATLVVAWVGAGVVLALRRPQQPLGLVVLAASAVAGVGLLARGSLATGSSDVAFLARALARALLPAFALHAVLGLPHGTLHTGARRRGTLVAYAGAVAVGLALFAPRPSLPTWPVVLEAALVAVVGGVASHRRYLAASASDRQRMQWMGWAVAVAVEVALVVLALRLFLGWPSHGAEVVFAATLLVPAAVVAGVSPLATRVDRLLAGTVSVAGLTGVVVAVYLVIVLGLGRTPTPRERTLLLLSMVASAVAALLWLPARLRLAQVANGLVYGEQQPPDTALRTFGSRLSRAIPMDELLLQLAESLHKTMALRSAEVWTGSNGVLERAASVPDRGPGELVLSGTEMPVVARAGVSGRAWVATWLPALLAGRPEAQLRVAPISHSGDLLGLIVVERDPERELFGEDEDQVLAELARQVGLALHNVQLDSALQASLDEVRRQAEELRVSRARVVAAGDAERRKIERNLHDGAQQHLVALAVKLRLARSLAEDDPVEARAMLEQLGEDVKETLQELRDLAHGIYPPLLMDSGLAAALSAAAGRVPLPTTVEASGIGRYPPDVEAAVYFCCMEALQNAGKHAGAGSHVAVRAWEEPGRLRFEVADDGAGFDPTHFQRGAGFVNMSDRLGAIGGAVEVDSAVGQGTRIAGSIPLAG